MDDGSSGCNQIGVPLGLPTVRQNRHVFQSGPDPVPPGNRTTVDVPTRDAIAVMDLFKRYARLSNNALDYLGMANGVIGIRIQWLDHDASTFGSQPRCNEPSRILRCQQTCFDADAPGHQEFADCTYANLSLVRCNQVGHFGPACDEVEALL